MRSNCAKPLLTAVILFFFFPLAEKVLLLLTSRGFAEIAAFETL